MWKNISLLWLFQTILHALPAVCFDIACSLTGQRAIWIKFYKNLDEFLKYFGHFTTKQFYFRDKTSSDLWTRYRKTLNLFKLYDFITTGLETLTGRCLISTWRAWIGQTLSNSMYEEYEFISLKRISTHCPMLKDEWLGLHFFFFFFLTKLLNFVFYFRLKILFYAVKILQLGLILLLFTKLCNLFL